MHVLMLILAHTHTHMLMPMLAHTHTNRVYELRNKERISVAAASKLLANMLYYFKGYGLSVVSTGNSVASYPAFPHSDSERLGTRLYMYVEPVVIIGCM